MPGLAGRSPNPALMRALGSWLDGGAGGAAGGDAGGEAVAARYGWRPGGRGSDTYLITKEDAIVCAWGGLRGPVGLALEPRARRAHQLAGRREELQLRLARRRGLAQGEDAAAGRPLQPGLLREGQGLLGHGIGGCRRGRRAEVGREPRQAGRVCSARRRHGGGFQAHEP